MEHNLNPDKYPPISFRPGDDFPKWQAVWNELQAQCPPSVRISWADVARHVLAGYLDHARDVLTPPHP